MVRDIPPESCKVRVVMGDGTSLGKEIRHAIGSVEKPMTDSQLTEKFVDQTSKVIGEERARKYSDICWSLEGSGDIGQLLSL